MTELYLCDPEKNKDCPKTHCFLIGGPCRRTPDESCRDERIRWIPFSEGTPKDGEWAFFTDGKSISIERYKKDALDHFFPAGRFFQLQDAVAWMPIETFGPLPKDWMTWEDLWIKDLLGG